MTLSHVNWFFFRLVHNTMAMSSTLAQDAIGCVLCDMPSQQFCNNCQINLCVDCISNHVGSLEEQEDPAEIS